MPQSVAAARQSAASWREENECLILNQKLERFAIKYEPCFPDRPLSKRAKGAADRFAGLMDGIARGH